MTFRTSWGISFHEYLVPLFSVRVSLQTRADRIGLNPRDRIRARSNRAKPKDRIGRNPNGPHPVDPEGSRPAETQVDPGRIRVGDPERPSSGRTRSHPSKVRPYPVETQVDPGRIMVGEPDWPASSRTDRPASGRSRSNPNGPHPALIQSNPTGPHPDKPTWPDPGKFKQTPAYSSKLRTNTSEPSR